MLPPAETQPHDGTMAKDERPATPPEGAAKATVPSDEVSLP
jgi:hypothetical protein